MIQLLISAFLLSIVHATIPNHWLPLVAIGKGENWSRSLTLRATLITGFAHIASTIFIGLIVGWAGLQFALRYHALFRVIAPSLLIILGIIYIILYFNKNKSHHHHHHHEEKKISKTSVRAIIISLAVSMFFSPCIELETYYFKAGDFGWQGILSVSLIYLIVTVGMMVLLVYLAIWELAKLNLHSLEHNERLIIGLILIITGVLIAFI